MERLNRIWKSSISFVTKYRLFSSLVLSIFLYGCEAWTLLAESEKRIQAFEFKCLRKLLRISYLGHKTNDYVRSTITSLVGPHEPLLATVKRRKLTWFGHITRHDSLSKTILQGTLEGGRRRGRQRKSWSDNVKEWTDLTMSELVHEASDRCRWRTLSAASSVVSPRRPPRSWDWWWWWCNCTRENTSSAHLRLVWYYGAMFDWMWYTGCTDGTLNGHHHSNHQ